MGKKRSEKNKGYYATYKSAGLYQKNRTTKLKRHVRANPNDKVAATYVESHAKVVFKYRRHKPLRQGHKMSRVEKDFREVLAKIKRLPSVMKPDKDRPNITTEYLLLKMYMKNPPSEYEYQKALADEKTRERYQFAA